MTSDLLTDIEAFIAANGMSESTFGRKALGDWRLIKELRGSEDKPARRLWPETERKIRHFIATYSERAA